MKTTMTLNTKVSGSDFSAHFTQFCSSCESHVKSVKREFSDQAWAALVSWSEISKKAVDAPLCNDCYMNCRDVLIERADDVRLMVSNAGIQSSHPIRFNAARA